VRIKWILKKTSVRQCLDLLFRLSLWRQLRTIRPCRLSNQAPITRNLVFHTDIYQCMHKLHLLHNSPIHLALLLGTAQVLGLTIAVGDDVASRLRSTVMPYVSMGAKTAYVSAVVETSDANIFRRGRMKGGFSLAASEDRRTYWACNMTSPRNIVGDRDDNADMR
jgi:hypothetical protein